jgi:hypothetical protein
MIISGIVLMVLLISLPLKVKEAIDILMCNEETIIDMTSLVGQPVSLLCERASWEVTEPPDYEFIIVAIENGKGEFEPVKIDPTYGAVGVDGIYIFPEHFVGGAVKRDPYGKNRFVFRGILNSFFSAGKDGYNGSFQLQIDSWDIVYPVQHWEWHLGPDNEFYKRNLFVFDYLIP